MAGNVRTISTRLQLDGEKKFKDAMQEIAASLRLGNTELANAAKMYDLNGNEQEKLTRQSQIYAKQIEQQTRVVQAYKERMEKALADPNVTQKVKTQVTTDYQVQANKLLDLQKHAKSTQAALESINFGGSAKNVDKFGKEVNDADRELEELGRDAPRVGKKLKDGLGDAADDVGDKFGDMMRSIQGSISDIRGLTAVSLAFDIGGGVKNAFQSATGFVQQYQNDINDLSRYEFNAAQAGIEQKMLSELLLQSTSFLGTDEMDSAIEGLSNLFATGLKGEALRTWNKRLLGAALKFPDTLKYESLADAFQESIATWDLTGAFEEMLGRAGADTAKLQEMIDAAPTPEAKMQVITTIPATENLDKYYQEFADTNENMLKTAEATTKLNIELSKLAKSIGTLVTPIIEFASGVVGKAAEAVDEVNKLINGDPEKEAKEKENIEQYGKKYTPEDLKPEESVALLPAARGLLTMRGLPTDLWDWNILLKGSEVFMPKGHAKEYLVEQYPEYFEEGANPIDLMTGAANVNVQKTALQNAANAMYTVAGASSGNLAKNVVEMMWNWISSIFSPSSAVAEEVQEKSKGQSAEDQAFVANVLRANTRKQMQNQDTLPVLGSTDDVSLSFESTDATLDEIVKKYDIGGKKSGEALVDGMMDGIIAQEGQLQAGIDDMISYIQSQMPTMYVPVYTRQANTVQSGPEARGFAGGARPINLSLNVNGREFARAVGPDINQELIKLK